MPVELEEGRKQQSIDLSSHYTGLFFQETSRQTMELLSGVKDTEEPPDEPSQNQSSPDQTSPAQQFDWLEPDTGPQTQHTSTLYMGPATTASTSTGKANTDIKPAHETTSHQAVVTRSSPPTEEKRGVKASNGLTNGLNTAHDGEESGTKAGAPVMQTTTTTAAVTTVTLTPHKSSSESSVSVSKSQAVKPSEQQAVKDTVAASRQAVPYTQYINAAKSSSSATGTAPQSKPPSKAVSQSSGIPMTRTVWTKPPPKTTTPSQTPAVTVSQSDPAPGGAAATQTVTTSTTTTTSQVSKAPSAALAAKTTKTDQAASQDNEQPQRISVSETRSLFGAAGGFNKAPTAAKSEPKVAGSSSAGRQTAAAFGVVAAQQRKAGTVPDKNEAREATGVTQSQTGLTTNRAGQLVGSTTVARQAPQQVQQQPVEKTQAQEQEKVHSTTVTATGKCTLDPWWWLMLLMMVAMGQNPGSQLWST